MCCVDLISGTSLSIQYSIANQTNAIYLHAPRTLQPVRLSIILDPVEGGANEQ